MKILMAMAAAAAMVSCAGGPQGPEPKYKNILVRDFRKGRDSLIVNYNIGTTAHCPGTIASLRKVLSDEVRITVWADMPLEPVIQQMMAERWPDVKIVYGRLDDNAPEDLKAAVEASDLLLVSSGSGVAASVRASLRQYRESTGKATGAYAVGAVNRDLLKEMDFMWYRDELSLRDAASLELPEIHGFAPDAVFDFDCTDEQTASRLLSDKGLKDKGYVCCIPGYRYTPGWEYFGGKAHKDRMEINAAMQEHDNGIIQSMICETVRDRGLDVLICPEQVPELRLARDVYKDLPDDVRAHCAILDTMWSPQTALSVYRRSLAVAGIQMHSQVMSVGSGIPAIILRHSGFGNKSDMWRTIGLSDWLIDIDDHDALQRACAALAWILDHPDEAQEKVAAARQVVDAARDSALTRTFLLPEQE